MAQTPPIPDGQSLDATRKAAGQVVTLAGAQVVAVQAAAATLGLPATDFDLGKPAAHSMVVAYDLTKTDPGAVAALRERAPGQILFERATCRSAPRQMRRLDDGTAGHGPADDRPIQAIAAEIVHATPEQDEGDGNTPRTSTKACAASSEQSRPQAHAIATAAGPAAPQVHPQRRPGTQQPLPLSPPIGNRPGLRHPLTPGACGRRRVITRAWPGTWRGTGGHGGLSGLRRAVPVTGARTCWHGMRSPVYGVMPTPPAIRRLSGLDRNCPQPPFRG